ncbi:unnamed protein product [Dracunculus medinensis]|uniref:HMG box domain-containing protein n=1 Tax=Dracunculus medinensis TaxID=318479 RepID=A0A0N4U1X5_DRAME|nr:unnamed protein product [Dracunculus medinensis]
MYRRVTTAPHQSVNADANSLKPPKAPERPLVPYMRFSRKMWAKVRAENPESQLWDIGKVIGQMWRDAPETEKLAYQQEYEIEKAEYEKALKNYHNSSAYQQYLTAKNRAKVADKSNTVGGVIASSKLFEIGYIVILLEQSRIVHLQSFRARLLLLIWSIFCNRARYESGGVVLQPVEDEELGDISSKRVAAMRFDRNHRLIADLFSGTVVTDTRTIVAQNRVDMLRKQAQSLTTHQSKLEDELKNLSEVFEAKKRQIEKSSEEFANKLKKACEEKPQFDNAATENLIKTWEKRLLTAYEEYKAKQEALRAQKIVEREHLVEETPILYRLTVGDSSPSPNEQKTSQSPETTTNDSANEKTESTMSSNIVPSIGDESVESS